jgi:hypothetical protein
MTLIEFLRALAWLGAGVFVAAWAMSRASSAFKARFVTSSEEYFERRKGRLLASRARPDEMRRARERALLVFTRLVAFERGGAGAVPDPKEREFAELALGHLPLKGVIQAIEWKVRALEEGRLKEAVVRMEAGLPLSSVRPLRVRDLVREMIIDQRPDLVDPFAPVPGEPPCD